MSELPLTARSAVVSGGTRGIGWAIAERLARDGADVLVTGTKSDGKGPSGTRYRCVDFSETAATDAFAEELARAAPDILVNNAGINKIAPFAEIDPVDFARIQQVNVAAPFRLARAVVPGMRTKGWGRIVNITSIWGKISRAQRASYSTSKFALDGMTAALAAEVAKDGILVNSVAPGIIDTELTRRVLGEQGVRDLSAQIPAGRLGTPEEVAALVAWLAGPDNTYVSGQNISIDGGLSRV